MAASSSAATTMRLSAVSFAALLCLLPAVAGAQFKWLDANGRVTYGDNPPRDARNIERVGAPVGEADPSAALPFEVRRAAATFPLTLYTAPDCAACAGARDLLRARGAPYTEITIGSARDMEAFRALNLGDRVPVLMVGRQALKELQPEQWHSTLDTAGYPRAATLPRNWRNPPPRPMAPQDPAAEAGTAPAQPR